MISIDLLKLATDKNAEQAFVEYMCGSLGIFGKVPKHRYVSDTFDVDIEADGVGEDNMYAFGFREPVTEAPDESRAFFLGSIWISVTVNWQGPGKWNAYSVLHTPTFLNHSEQAATNPYLFARWETYPGAFNNEPIQYQLPVLVPVEYVFLSVNSLAADTKVNMTGVISYSGMYLEL